MIYVVCDACGNEVKTEGRSIDVPTHLDENISLLRSYVNVDNEVVNRKTTNKDLCIKCYNRVMEKAVVEIKRIAKGGSNDRN